MHIFTESVIICCTVLNCFYACFCLFVCLFFFLFCFVLFFVLFCFSSEQLVHVTGTTVCAKQNDLKEKCDKNFGLNLLTYPGDAITLLADAI